PLTGSRFSYHFDFRRRRVGVRGLDYPFAMTFGAVGAARLVSTPSPSRGLARDWRGSYLAFPEFERFCSASFLAGTPIEVCCVYLFATSARAGTCHKKFTAARARLTAKERGTGGS